MASEKGLAYQLDWGDRTMSPPPPSLPSARRPPLPPPPPLSALPPPPLPRPAPRAVKERLGSAGRRAGAARAGAVLASRRPAGRSARALTSPRSRARAGGRWRRAAGCAGPQRGQVRAAGRAGTRPGPGGRPPAAPPPPAPAARAARARPLPPPGRAKPPRTCRSWGDGQPPAPHHPRALCGRPADLPTPSCPRRAAGERPGRAEASSLEANRPRGLQVPLGWSWAAVHATCPLGGLHGEAAGAAQARAGPAEAPCDLARPRRPTRIPPAAAGPEGAGSRAEGKLRKPARARGGTATPKSVSETETRPRPAGRGPPLPPDCARARTPGLRGRRGSGEEERRTARGRKAPGKGQRRRAPLARGPPGPALRPEPPAPPATSARKRFLFFFFSPPPFPLSP